MLSQSRPLEFLIVQSIPYSKLYFTFWAWLDYSNLLAGDKTLFLIDDIIADETLNKCWQLLLELAISGRHRGHSLWLLTQSYTAVPNNIRR